MRRRIDMVCHEITTPVPLLQDAPDSSISSRPEVLGPGRTPPRRPSDSVSALSGFEVGEDREHPAVIPVTLGQAQFQEDVADVLLDRTVADHQLPGDRGVRPALGHQPQHLPLPRRQLGQHILLTAAAEQLRHHLRVQRGAAPGRPAAPRRRTPAPRPPGP